MKFYHRIEPSPSAAVARYRPPAACSWLGSDPCQHGVGSAKPGSFAATQVSRHRGLFREYLLGPFPSFFCSALRLQEDRVMVIGFGDGRNTSSFAKHRFGLVNLPS